MVLLNSFILIYGKIRQFVRKFVQMNNFFHCFSVYLFLYFYNNDKEFKKKNLKTEEISLLKREIVSIILLYLKSQIVHLSN